MHFPLFSPVRPVTLPPRRRIVLALLATSLIMTILLLAACGGQSNAASRPSAEPTGAGTADGVVVEMTNQNRFVPDKLTVPRGATVTFKNVGSALHNVVTDPSKAADPAHAATPAGVEPFASPMVKGGGAWSYTFEAPGEYIYFCQPHEALGMVGVITVAE